MNRADKVLQDAIVWHAAKVIGCERLSAADRMLQKSVARYLGNMRLRDKRRKR